MKIVLLTITFFSVLADGSFLDTQLTYPRVRKALEEYDDAITQRLDTLGVAKSGVEVFIRVFKQQRKLETWVKSKSEQKFQLYKTIPFCTSSGVLGPKRQQGDGQTPEGLYSIDRFNPYSNFYLSLGINYPNASDRVRATGNPGGDIFIHGSCVTIGCIPITDNGIMELYALCVLAKDAGQSKIQVHIFPDKITDAFLEKSQQNGYGNQTAFWRELKPFYEFFEKQKSIPGYSISSSGNYQLK